jgi:predicted alpha-1,2-mannosidase
MQKFLLSSFSIFILLLGFIEKVDSQPLPIKDEAGKSPYDYVNPFIGTGGEGHTYPGAVMPFGMVQLSPDTEIKYFRQSFPWCAGYQYGDSAIIGFSHTHFSGTGHSDLGDILIMPTTGPLKLEPGSSDKPGSGFRSRFSHDEESALPGYYSVVLKDYNIKAELTASYRTGFHRYTFSNADSARIILDLMSSIYNYDGKVTWAQIQVVNDTLVTGYRQTRGWAPNRQVYFAIRFSKPVSSYGLQNGDSIPYKGQWKWGKMLENFPEVMGKKLRAYFNFNFANDEVLMVKVGLSSVDVAGAIRNMDTEIPHWNFDQTRQEAKAAWEKELDKIVIGGNPRDKEIFYTSVYHSYLTPFLYMDVDRRYRGLDLSIHQADGFDNYTTFSLWDTYRALHPLLTITQPERAGNMINSMIAHWEQSAFHMLPIWSFHANEDWCMIGYHAVSVISDAYLKGISNYDAEKALRACIETATHRDYDGLGYYMDLGFVPIDKEPEGASKTLEYAYDDWSIAQMAKAMGRMNTYDEFMKRAANYRNVFEAKTSFMRARKSDGTWREPFDPLLAQYGGDYTEGNAWQYSWYVPQDVHGLITLMGGDKNFIRKLDSVFMIKTDEEKYKQVEDIAGLIGQYAQGNEPSHHIAYLYNYAGAPWKTQERIHQIMKNLFDNTSYGICGNEDCGQMSAWFIFSSLGFYPVCPGSLQYVIGSPCIPNARIMLENGRQFTMTAKNLNDKNIYIQSVTLNGKPLNRSYLTHSEIIDGGTMVFIMGPRPNKRWAASPQDAPYSMSQAGNEK